jgi:hypothetical protein
MTKMAKDVSKFVSYYSFVSFFVGIVFSVAGAGTYFSTNYTTKDEFRQVKQELGLRYDERNSHLETKIKDIDATVVEISSTVKTMDCKYDAILDVLVLHSKLPLDQKNKILDIKNAQQKSPR